MQRYKKIYPIASYEKIQVIRAIHAIAETDYTVCIPAEHASKFELLSELFNMKYTTAIDGGIEIKDIEIIHSQPLTSIGSLSRPLIFPHAITRYCKSIWQNDRPYKYSFAGLFTEQRRSALYKWVNQNLGIDNNHCTFLGNSLLSKIKRKIFKKRHLNYTKKIGDLTLWSSSRGRTFPVKSWDDDYFRLMSKSEYVLCPNGVYIWTYRFFEAILCGAIPIVEDECDEYTGFKYLKMSDKISDLPWSKEVIEYNYRLCVEKITLPVKDLDNEIGKLIELQVPELIRR